MGDVESGSGNEERAEVTSIEDALFGRVLTSVPELPGFGFFIGALLLTEHQHDDALYPSIIKQQQNQTKQNQINYLTMDQGNSEECIKS